MVSFLGGDDGSKGRERKVNTRETKDINERGFPYEWLDSRNQVGLELSQIHVKRTIESEGGCNGRDHLSNQSIQIGEAWRCDIQVLFTDVVNGLIVNLIISI